MKEKMMEWTTITTDGIHKILVDTKNEELIISIIRYQKIGGGVFVIRKSVPADAQFSNCLDKINRIIRLDTELFNLVAETLKS